MKNINLTHHSSLLNQNIFLLVNRKLVAEGENGENEDLIETQYLNGNNEVVKIFNQKCVICLERVSIYAFRQCGHQCICQDCYENKRDIDILKSVVCRTYLKRKITISNIFYILFR